MRASLQFFNLLGVVILVGLCVIQWRNNRDLNLETNRLERQRLEQQAQIEEQDRTIQGYVADLDRFREQLSQAADRLRECESRLTAASRELTQIGLERDQLRISVTNWTDAVAARDVQLELAAAQMKQLETDRNDAIIKFNELADKQNELVHEMNERTRQFNELAERYQKLAKP